MAVNQQRKAAMKRLMYDQEELKNCPVANVSAAPLDDNMFEWHCNFNHGGVIYHLILFFPECYPYKSPSAEFMPYGFTFFGGATKQGKKGTQVCLSIFSDFAEWHTEWAKEKSMGWSPGYTVQTVLMNMVAFLAEHQPKTYEPNKKLSEKFSCSDCGHTYKKPFPPLTKDSSASAGQEEDTAGPHIIDYISKAKFIDKAPKSKEDLFGYGLIKGGPPHRPELTTPCEFLQGSSYFGMKKSVGMVQSILKEDLAFFLPLFITPTHGKGIKETFEETMKEIAKVLPGCSNKTPLEDMVIKTLPNLMSATVVAFSKGTQHASDNHLSGYFSLHRLFLWATETYPHLQKVIDERLQNFIDNPDQRSKKSCPHIGEWLVMLSGSAKYRWRDAADAYLFESWRRNVMWYVKDDKKLGFLDTAKAYRLDKTLAATAVSRKLLAFQVLFLDIAMPEGMTRKQIIARYDANHGFPTPAMVEEMKASCARIAAMKTYQDWFKVLKLDPPSDDEIFKKLIKAVRYSIKTDGYFWSLPRNAGGWVEVRKRYKGGLPAGEGDSDDDEGAGKPAKAGSSKSKGRGKRSKAADEEGEVAIGGGRGRGKRSKTEEKEEEKEMEVVETSKGRGRGKKVADAKVGRGRGAKRGKRK